MTKGKNITEKRLLIDIAAACEAYHVKDITQVGLISKIFNPADGLTKVKENGALRRLTITGREYISLLINESYEIFKTM